MIGGNNLHQQMSRIQKVVSEVEHSESMYELQFNALKTEVIIFSRARLKQGDYPNELIIDNMRIPFGTSVKYLGVTLDHKLNWTLHIKNKIKKAKQTLFALRHATNKKWGPRPTYMKWAYNAVVKSRLTYGAVVWGPALRYTTLRDKMNKINFLAVSMIGNTRKTTPRLALEIIFDLPSLDLVINYEALASIARNRNIIDRDWPGYNKKHKTLKGHVLYWEQLAEQMGISPDSTDAIKTELWDRSFRVHLESFKNLSHPVMTQVNVFTDGSKIEQHVGSGFVIYANNEEIATDSIRLADEITVNQAEVLPIKQAVLKLIEVKTKNHKFVKIFSDSQAALLSLANWTVKSNLALVTINLLNILSHTSLRLELVLIKAHYNYKENERADELARNAVLNNVIQFKSSTQLF